MIEAVAISSHAWRGVRNQLGEAGGLVLDRQRLDESLAHIGVGGRSSFEQVVCLSLDRHAGCGGAAFPPVFFFHWGAPAPVARRPPPRYPPRGAGGGGAGQKASGGS